MRSSKFPISKFTLVAMVTLLAIGLVGFTRPAGADTPAGSAVTGHTTWLCLPGQAHNPCTPDLTVSRVSFTNPAVAMVRAKPAAHPKIDCFYVYPTVSDQKTPNANLTVDPQEVSIAQFQAAMFSRVCKVYAPMYRQLTLSNIGGAATPAQQALAYGDVRTAWSTYLHLYNHGRGVVLIGHSQGAFLLRRLITTQVDTSASARRLMVSAILLGGNVTVRNGSDVGGDFRHIRACHSATQTGCVLAWSTFGTTPPGDAVFGRTTTPGLQVLCTNPAALAGGTGLLNPLLPTRPFAPGSSIAAGISLLGIRTPPASTPWISAPGSYSAQCVSNGGASVLEVAPRNGAPALHPSPLATWGLHLVDVNIAFGNLLGIVAAESASYHPPH